MGAVNTYASWSPDGSKILLRRKTANDSRVSQIYVMNPDGSGLTKISNDSSYNRYPSWSPSGQQIVFTSDRAGHSQILVMNSNGTDVRVLVDGPQGHCRRRVFRLMAKPCFMRGISGEM